MIKRTFAVLLVVLGLMAFGGMAAAAGVLPERTLTRGYRVAVENNSLDAYPDPYPDPYPAPTRPYSYPPPSADRLPTPVSLPWVGGAGQ